VFNDRTADTEARVNLLPVGAQLCTESAQEAVTQVYVAWLVQKAERISNPRKKNSRTVLDWQVAKVIGSSVYQTNYILVGN
jgi:hypothetical protein